MEVGGEERGEKRRERVVRRERERRKERREREGKEDGEGEEKRLLQRKSSHLGTEIME